MIKNKFFIIFAIFTFASFAFLNPYSKADMLVKNLIEIIKHKNSQINSYTANYIQKMKVDDKLKVQKGTIFFLKDKGIREEIDRESFKLNHIYTKEYKLSYSSSDKENATIVYFNPIREKFGKDLIVAKYFWPKDIKTPFSCINLDNLMYIGKSDIGKKSVYIFTASPESILLEPGKIKLWVRKKDGLLTKLIIFDTEGNKNFQIEYYNIEKNIDISPDTIIPILPSDFNITNRTDEMITFFKTTLSKEKPPLD